MLAGMGGFFHKTMVYALPTKYLFSHLEVMGVLSMYGITIGIAFALFFGNYLYKLSGNNMLTPSLSFVILTLLLFLPLALKYIPDDKAEEIQEEKKLQAESPADSEGDQRQESGRKLVTKRSSSLSRTVSIVRLSFPLRKLLCNCKVLTFYGVLFTYIYTQQFYIAYLNTSLQETYSLSELSESFIQSTRAMGGILTCWSTPFIRKKLSRKNVVLFVFMLQCVAMLLLGPSKMFQFPASLALLVCGLALKGCCDGFVFSVILPEIIHILSRKYEGVYDPGRIGDTASGILQVTMEVSMIVSHQVGPLLC